MSTDIAVEALIARARQHSARGLPITAAGSMFVSDLEKVEAFNSSRASFGGRVEHQSAFDDRQKRELVSHFAAIHDLLQKEQIAAARKLLAMVPAAGSEEPALSRLRRALAPPIVRPSPRIDINRTQAYAWLRQHRQEYKGQWVAVGANGLVALAPTLRELNDQLRHLAPVEQPLIHKL